MRKKNAKLKLRLNKESLIVLDNLGAVYGGATERISCQGDTSNQTLTDGTCASCYCTDKPSICFAC